MSLDHLVEQALLRGLPPMRREQSTLPYDLREYAQLHTGPGSWTDEIGVVSTSESSESGDSSEPPPVSAADDDAPASGLSMASRQAVLRVTIAPDELREHSFDGPEALVLSIIDGERTVESVCDVAGLPVDEALCVLCELRERGILTIASPTTLI